MTMKGMKGAKRRVLLKSALDGDMALRAHGGVKIRVTYKCTYVEK